MNANPKSWRQHVDVLYDAGTIQSRIAEMGQSITEHYAGEPVVMVGILKGSFIFYSDLCRAIDGPVETEFMGISSYGDATTSSGVVKITSDLGRSIENKNVLIVEDIIDTGLTMRYLIDNLSTRSPKSLKVCTLLHKPANNEVEVPMDYVGFTIPDKFVVGYGLDLASLYRNLPFIGVYTGPV